MDPHAGLGSHSQFDAYPSAVRLTVTARASSVNGELHNE
jgi:hypothetical protein